jgi:hypothetical protein
VLTSPLGRGTLIGRIVTALDGPVDGAKVTLSCSAFDAVHQRHLRAQLSRPFPTQTTSDAAGRFRFQDLPAVSGYGLHGWCPQGHATTHASLTLRPQEVLDAGDLVLQEGCSLSGTVQESTGEGFADVLVTLQRSDSQQFQVQSDAAGDFRFEGVPRGTARVIPSHPGWRTSNDLGSYTLAPGHPTEGVVLRLQRTVAVHGRVQDPDGNPLVNVALRALPATTAGLETGEDLEAVSEASGAFLCKGLWSGATYSMEARLAGFRLGLQTIIAAPDREILITLERQPTFTLRVLAADDGSPIKLEWARISFQRPGRNGYSYQESVASQASGLLEMEPGQYAVPFTGPGQSRLRLRADGFLPKKTEPMWVADTSTVLEVALERGCLIRGSLREAGSGRPLQAAWIGLGLPKDAGSTGSTTAFGADPMLFRSHTVTQKEGDFVFAGLEPGNYLLRARVPGFCEALTGPIRLAASGDVAEPTLELVRGGEIHGTVRGLDQKGLAAIQVSALRSDGLLLIGVSDRQGQFFLGPLEPGEYDVAAQAYETVESERLHLSRSAVVRPKGPIRSRRIRVRSAEISRCDLDIADPQQGTLSGMITLNGRAGSSLRLLLLPRSGPSDAPEWQHVPTVRTSNSGAFILTGLTPMTYEVFVHRSHDQGPLHRAKISLPEGVPQQLDLQLHCGSLYGRIQHAASGKALAGVQVELALATEDPATSAAGFFATHTADDGVFYFAELLPGPYWMDLYHPERYQRHRIEIESGREVEFFQELQPGGSLRLDLRVDLDIHRLQVLDDRGVDQFNAAQREQDEDQSLKIGPLAQGQYEILLEACLEANSAPWNRRALVQVLSGREALVPASDCLPWERP